MTLRSLLFGLGAFFSALTAVPVLAQVNVFACEPEWAALINEIGGPYVKSTSATTAFQDAHYIEAKPSLIAKARNADVLLCTGAELEVGWLPILLRQSGNPDIQPGKLGHILAADYVEKIEVPERLDRSMGDIHGAGNPHVHLDPYRMQKIADVVAQRLAKIDPEHGAYYGKSAAEFKTRWQNAIQRWEQQAKPLKGKRVVIHHRSQSYLFNWLGMDIVADLEPRPGIPPTSRHLASVLAETKTTQPDLVVVSAYQNDRGARWLSKRTDKPVVVLPFTVGGTKDANNLTQLFDVSIQRLLEALPNAG